MAKKDSKKSENKPVQVVQQPITRTLEVNFMPYAMSVIMSRAIPEIDGFKPSHRKLLYTMYKMGLLTGNRTKSANVVGQCMKLNPHGESAIYETLVRLSRGHEALLVPFVDSKGNFGKFYSRDMAYAASRYTEVKLAPICQELFRDIDCDCVDFVDNYDSTTREPVLLPATFPNLLVSANQGIAVGMASNICGFNLTEVCKTTIAYIKNPNCDLFETLPAPDFSTGGEILFEKEAFEEIYRTGKGSFRIRARWRYDKKENLIEIYEIPYTTTIEAIMDKVAELIKSGNLRDITDMRDETDLKGLKLTVSLKRGADPEKVMQNLFRLTPLMDTYSCNFNLLIAGTPRQMGIAEILDEWIAWRYECVRRRTYYQLQQKRSKLHLLKGLSKILLDIDRAIRIIRETEEEDEVVPNLMIGFQIDREQAEFIAEIKLRNINKQYILRRIEETGELEKEIASLEDVLKSRDKVMDIIIKELEAVSKKYGEPRRTGIVYDFDLTPPQAEEKIDDYQVNVFLSKEGYFKKITPLSLRMGGEQRFKENDELSQSAEASNADEIIFFTNKQQAYKCRLYEFEDSKASVLGDYLPAKLGMDEGESVIYMCLPGDYSGYLLFFFENGKVAKVNINAYQTKSNRKRLTGAYSDKSPVVAIRHIREDEELAIFSSDTRVLLFNTASLTPKDTRTTIGVSVMSVKSKHRVVKVMSADEAGIVNRQRYRTRTLPAAGSFLKPEDIGETQINMEEI
ncbi:MAG: topoisomerase IV [Clostridiales bacterium]|nr:topoisomerase IV [Clostridiales bacterium]